MKQAGIVIKGCADVVINSGKVTGIEGTAFSVDNSKEIVVEELTIENCEAGVELKDSTALKFNNINQSSNASTSKLKKNLFHETACASGAFFGSFLSGYTGPNS